MQSWIYFLISVNNFVHGVSEKHFGFLILNLYIYIFDFYCLGILIIGTSWFEFVDVITCSDSTVQICQLAWMFKTCLAYSDIKVQRMNFATDLNLRTGTACSDIKAQWYIYFGQFHKNSKCIFWDFIRLQRAGILLPKHASSHNTTEKERSPENTCPHPTRCFCCKSGCVNSLFDQRCMLLDHHPPTSLSLSRAHACPEIVLCSSKDVKIQVLCSSKDVKIQVLCSSKDVKIQVLCSSKDVKIQYIFHCPGRPITASVKNTDWWLIWAE